MTPPTIHQIRLLVGSAGGSGIGTVVGSAVGSRVGWGVSEMIEITSGVGVAYGVVRVDTVMTFGACLIVIIFYSYLRWKNRSDHYPYPARSTECTDCSIGMRRYQRPRASDVFSITWFVPSPKINSAALMYPPGSAPEQVNVTASGVPTAVEISVTRLAQIGTVF